MSDDEPIRCVQCGQARDTIKKSQRRGDYNQIRCATVDYFGECEAEWERHKFPRKNNTQAGGDS